jgi:hypothetical protein
MKGADTATDEGGESKISEALKGPVRVFTPTKATKEPQSFSK